MVIAYIWCNYTLKFTNMELSKEIKAQFNETYKDAESASELLYQMRCVVMEKSFKYIKLVLNEIGGMRLPETEDALAIDIYTKEVTHSAGWDGEDEVSDRYYYCKIEDAEYCLDFIDGKEAVDLIEHIAMRINHELNKTR